MCNTKLYVVKHNQLGFLTETIDYSKNVAYAMFFDDYEFALSYCFGDCFILELDLFVSHIKNPNNLNFVLRGDLILR